MGFRFKDLEIYQDARIFIKEIYKLSNSFPEHEKYGLTSQLNRASVSILLNIAEGSSRGSDKDFNRFVFIAIGSLSEVVAVLDICKDLEYVKTSQYHAYMIKCETLAKRLYCLSRALKKH